MPTITITEVMPEQASGVSMTTLTRSDTGLTPTGVTLPLAFTDQGGGGTGISWGTSFVDPASAPAHYSFTLHIVWPDLSYNDVPGTFFPDGYQGRYTSVARLKTRRGTTNINEWSSTDGTGTEDTAAEQEAIEWAEDFIDDFFNGSIYAIPFTATGSALPRTLVEWATILASYWLYDKRGLNDADPKTHKLEADRERVLGEMQMTVGCSRELRGVAYRTGATRAVQVVAPFENRLSDGAGLVPTTQSRYAGRGWISRIWSIFAN